MLENSNGKVSMHKHMPRWHPIVEHLGSGHSEPHPVTVRGCSPRALLKVFRSGVFTPVPRFVLYPQASGWTSRPQVTSYRLLGVQSMWVFFDILCFH